jgi:hypothetical protein
MVVRLHIIRQIRLEGRMYKLLLRKYFVVQSTMFLAALSSATHSVGAKEFAIRQVTNFENPGSIAAPRPMGVLNGELIFSGNENRQEGIYRTDGTNVHRIDNPNNAESPSFEFAQIANEFLFSATGADGEELYATDGQLVRQIADIAPGSLDSMPFSFQLLNGQLLFHAITDDPSTGIAPIKFFHTDGTTIEQFPVGNNDSLYGSAILGNRLFFSSVQQLYSTDGQSVGPIPAPPLVIDSSVFSIQSAGDSVYLIAGNGPERGFYRTEGMNAELVATLDSLVPASRRMVSMFELGGSLHIAILDRSVDELIFFRTSGEPPIELERWPVPADAEIDSPFTHQPIFSDGQAAYFTFGGNGGDELYEFNGNSFNQLTNSDGGSASYRFLTAGDRVFVTIRSSGNVYSLFEVANGNLVPLGPGFESIVLFDGELFGASGTNILSRTLWRTKNGQLVPFGDVPVGSIRFVEYDGQLYFGGTNGFGGTGENTAQLYAIVPVPEPSSLTHLVVGLLCVVLLAWQSNYIARSPVLGCRS